MSTRIFSNSPAKNIVRGEWDKPILEYIYRKSNIKYLYLGLPGVELLDIRSWREMIGKVIAFERHKYAADVESELIKLSIPFKVYTGYLETTVMQGEDLDGTPYSQKEIVTLYNLDYCDHITSGTGSRKKKNERLEAIGKLLIHQREAYNSDNRLNKFILLITLRSGYHIEHIKKYISNGISSESQRFISRILSIEFKTTEPMGGDHRVLKAYICDKLIDFFNDLQISYYFLPPVRYFGGANRDVDLVHFMLFCKLNPLTGVAHTQTQKKEEFLKLKTFVVHDGKMIFDEHEGEENELGLNPTEIMRNIDDIIFSS